MGKFLIGVLTGIAAVVTTALVSDKLDTYLSCKLKPLQDEDVPIPEETGESDDE